MAMPAWLGNAATVIALACTVTVTGISINRHVGGRSSDRRPAHTEPVVVDDWRRYLDVDRRIGPAAARVTIIEFTDYECPSCRRFATKTWPAVVAKYPNDVALVIRHWPLPYHKTAYRAARAAECAATQGRFAAYHERLFHEQDSLGVKPLDRVAAEVGVPDLKAFAACATRTDSVARINAGMRDALLAGGRGTPTIIVNGLRMARSPDSTQLFRLIDEALKKDR
jgi:protein-disulfide isomerase